ncbi:Ras GTPase-activating protein 2, partial [Rhizophlyctis rosea]
MDLSRRTVDPKTNPDSPYWKSQRLSVKIIEAKHLTWLRKGERTCDPYVVCRIDNRTAEEQRTSTVWNSEAPFWSEEFTFEDIEPFRQLNVTLWNDSKDASAKPMGRVVFPRRYLLGDDEQWFNITKTNDDGSVSGELRVRIKYYPAKEEGAASAFAVRVVAGRDLATDGNTPPNPYAVLHLLPDQHALSMQQTRVREGTANPQFSETFVFTVPVLEPDQEIHFSLWNRSSNGTEDGFLGHFSVSVVEVVMGGRVDRWFPLLPAPLAANGKIGKSKDKKKGEEDKRHRPRAFVQALQRMPEDGAPPTRKRHNFEESLAPFGTCAHCSGMLIGLHLRCGECKVACHHKCKDIVAPHCGGVGVMRLRYKYEELMVLRMPYYEPLLHLLEKQDYAVLVILGRVSGEREDAARSLVRIFDSRSTLKQFLKKMIAIEVANAEDSKTLFRANSMATKALDVFMKHVGGGYLVSVLQSIIKAIVTTNRPTELDPTKLPKDENLQQNINSLTLYNTIIVDSIFRSVDKFPPRLREIFQFLQDEVSQRFPNEEGVRYTAVSGFIFLRFFAPAILGPKLFGFESALTGGLDARAIRTLTLSAKVLQGLANLVEFGQKEAFMTPMNGFIAGRIEGMKRFIDEISTSVPYQQVHTKIDSEVTNYEEEKECGELYGYLSRGMEKMMGAENVSSSDRKLLHQVKSELKTIEETLESLQRETPGVDSLQEEGNSPIEMSEEERMIDVLLEKRTLMLREQRNSFRSAGELE